MEADYWITQEEIRWVANVLQFCFLLLLLFLSVVFARISVNYFDCLDYSDSIVPLQWGLTHLIKGQIIFNDQNPCRTVKSFNQRSILDKSIYTEYEASLFLCYANFRVREPMYPDIVAPQWGFLSALISFFYINYKEIFTSIAHFYGWVEDLTIFLDD